MKKISSSLFILFTLFCVTSCDLFMEEEGNKKDKEYSITFEANGGSGSMEPIKAKEGESVTLPKNIFKKSGFKFTGWNLVTGDSTTVLKDQSTFKMVKGNIVLKAKWEDLTRTITFDANGGEGSMDSQSGLEGTTVKLSSNSFTKSGFHFIGWTYTIDSVETLIGNESDFTFGNSDVTLVATWSVNSRVITFDSNGGEGSMSPQVVNEGDNVKLSKNLFTKLNSQFLGWIQTVNSAQNLLEDEANITVGREDINLVAKWGLIARTVTYDANGGTGSMEPINGYQGESVTLTKNSFTNPGLEFYGWILVKDSVETILDDEALYTLGTSDVVLKAKWGPIRRTLAFDANGGQGSMASIVIPEGNTITLPKSTLTKAGFEFYGWILTQNSVETVLADESSFTMADSDITLKAKWGPIRYTLTFDSNGGTGSMDTKVLIQGESLTLPGNAFSNSTLHFIEWNTDPQGNGTSYRDLSSLTMGNKNLVLYAQWSRLFITKWNVTRNKLMFPLSSTGVYDFIIDWGDGTESHITTGNVTSINGQEYVEHTYRVNKEYNVKVLGTLKGFGYSSKFAGSHPDSRLIDVLEWGNIQLHNNGYQFYKQYINFTAIDNLDLSNVTNMEYIFMESTVNRGIEDWNVSNVINLMYAFKSSIINADISKWNVSNVTNIHAIFKEATLNSDISKWDVSSVEYLTTAFFGTVGSIDVSDWNVSNVIDMYGVFAKNMSIDNMDLSKWKTSKVTRMRSMFFQSTYNGDISMWDVSNVDDFSYMFYGNTGFTCGGINVNNWNWNVNSSLGVDKFENTFTGTAYEHNKPSWCK